MNLLESAQLGSSLLESTQVATETPEPVATPQGYGMTTSQAIKAHKASVLEAVSLEDLPDYEVYEMNGKGLSVLKHNKRYA